MGDSGGADISPYLRVTGGPKPLICRSCHAAGQGDAGRVDNCYGGDATAGRADLKIVNACPVGASGAAIPAVCI